MRRISIILAGLLIISACENSGQESVLTSFSAETDIESWYWKDGDVIRFSNGKQTSDYYYDAVSEKFKSDKPIEKTDNLQGFFPAERADFLNGGLRLSLPAEQSAITEDRPSLPMYFWKNVNDVLRFKSLLGVVKLSLSGSGTALYEGVMTDLVFSSVGNPVCGTATVGSDGSITLSDAAQELKVVCPEHADVRSTVEFLLPAQKYPMGSKVVFHFSDGKSVEAETIMGIVPRRGMVKSYEIEITSDFFGPLEEYEDGGSLDDKF